MLCALTVRKLNPGALEDFKEAFIPRDAPPGWSHFYALQNVDDEDEVITFGFFDGTPEELRASHSESAGDYEHRRRAAQQLIESVGANGVYEVFEERSFG
jgi:heme-degrading monooxygenase HmoA